MLVFGSTMAGKTTLNSDMLDFINLVYDLKGPLSSEEEKLIIKPGRMEHLEVVGQWVVLETGMGHVRCTDGMVRSTALPPNLDPARKTSLMRSSAYC